MITLDDTEEAGPLTDATPAAIPIRSLLAACAREAAHLALALSDLDATLGKAIGAAQPTAGLGQSETGFVFLHRGLQNADRSRQEGEGLAKMLSMLATAPNADAEIPTADIRACMPLVAQQRRVLALATTLDPVFTI